MLDNPSQWAKTLEVDQKNLDERTLKSAYARKIKTIDPVKDPEGFQKIRSAFEGLKKGIRRANKRAKPMPSFEPVDYEKPVASRPINKKKTTPANTEQIKRPKPEPSAKKKNPKTQPEKADVRVFATAAGEVENELRKAQELAMQVRKLINSPWAAAEWKRIFADPAMNNMAAAEIVENAIAQELIAYIAKPDNKNELPIGLKQEAIELIDERFLWYSDFTRLKNKFGFRAKQLTTILMTSQHRPIEPVWRMPKPEKPRSALSKMTFAQRLDIVLLSRTWFGSSFTIAGLAFIILKYISPYLAP